MPNLSTLAPAWERARERGSYDDFCQYILTESQKYLQLRLSEYFVLNRLKVRNLSLQPGVLESYFDLSARMIILTAKCLTSVLSPQRGRELERGGHMTTAVNTFWLKVKSTFSCGFRSISPAGSRFPIKSGTTKRKGMPSPHCHYRAWPDNPEIEFQRGIVKTGFPPSREWQNGIIIIGRLSFSGRMTRQSRKIRIVWNRLLTKSPELRYISRWSFIARISPSLRLSPTSGERADTLLGNRRMLRKC